MFSQIINKIKIFYKNFSIKNTIKNIKITNLDIAFFVSAIVFIILEYQYK